MVKRKPVEQLNFRERRTLTVIWEGCLIHLSSKREYDEQREYLLSKARGQLGQLSIRLTTASFEHWADNQANKWFRTRPPKLREPSSEELRIAECLTQLNIRFQREAEFPGLTRAYDPAYALPVDFAIEVEGRVAMIEYNGPHHEEIVTKNDIVSSNTLNQFINRKENDARKIAYSKAQDVPLLVIHYSDSDVLEDIVTQYVHDIANDQKSSSSYSERTFAVFGHKERNELIKEAIFNTSERG